MIRLEVWSSIDYLYARQLHTAYKDPEMEIQWRHQELYFSTELH